MNSRHRKDTASSQILPSHLEFLAQLAHSRSKHKSVKIYYCSFKSVGITGSKVETDSKENEKEVIPRVLQNLINWEKERHAKPLMIEIMLVNMSIEKDPDLI